MGVDIDKAVDGKIEEHGGAGNTFDPLIEQHLIQPVQNGDTSMKGRIGILNRKEGGSAG